LIGPTRVGNTTVDPNIKICAYNVNSLNPHKLAIILSVMKVLAIDVFVCTDTRHRESSSRAYTLQAKQVLGLETRVVHSPIKAHKALRRDSYHSSVGGQLIVIAPSWAGSITDQYQDPSNFGLVSGVTLGTGNQKGKLLILGNYWPFPASSSKEEQGLWTRTAQYLKKQKGKKDPHEYIKSIITGKAEKHNSKSPLNYTIVCGDFNHGWETGKYQLKKWAEENNWAAPSVQHAKEANCDIFTFYRKSDPTSWIDHFLITPASADPVALSTTSFTGGIWADISDHRPIMVGLQLPGIERRVGNKK